MLPLPIILIFVGIALLLLLGLLVIINIIFFSSDRHWTDFSQGHAENMHKTLQRTINMLDSGGVKHALAFGTLLAWKRTTTSSPFSWDDDLDLVVPMQDFEKVQALVTRCDQFQLKFVQAGFGYQLQAVEAQPNLKSFVVDIFFLTWDLADNKACLMKFSEGEPQNHPYIDNSRHWYAVSQQETFGDLQETRFWGMIAKVPASEAVVHQLLKTRYGPEYLSHAVVYNHHSSTRAIKVPLGTHKMFNSGLPVPQHTTVITFGTFDLLHEGHLSILKRARSQGSRLVVGVSSDQLNWQKKGVRSAFDQNHRMALIRSLWFVDHVFLEESLALKAQYVTRFGAHVLVMGDDHLGRFDGLAPRVLYLPRTRGVSTTEKLQEIRAGPL